MRTKVHSVVKHDFIRFFRIFSVFVFVYGCGGCGRFSGARFLDHDEAAVRFASKRTSG